MTYEELKCLLSEAKRDARHNTNAETRYWCAQYKQIAIEAVKALEEALIHCEDNLNMAKPEQVDHCKAKRDNNGVCHNHNLQCGLPRCNEPPTKQEEYLSKAYRLANELQRHLAIAPAPQQRTWVGLTDVELVDCMTWSIKETCQAIEAKLKKKNT